MSDQLQEAERRALDAWVPMAPPADFAARVVAKHFGLSRRLVGGVALAAALAAVAAVLLLWPVPSPRAPIARITLAEGPIETMHDGPWQSAKVGASIYLGDGVRTADGVAELSLREVATLRMDKFTVLRFGDASRTGTSNIGVELGAIEISGSGVLGLDVGDVRLDRATVRVAARENRSTSLELLVGMANFTAVDGKTIDLAIGNSIPTAIGIGPIATVDASATVVPESDNVAIEITGRSAELKREGETEWQPLPAGVGTVSRLTKVRLGPATTSRLTANATELELAPGSRLAIRDDLGFALELGTARARVGEPVERTVAVPGGSVVLAGAGDARIDVDARGEAKIVVLQGHAKVVGNTTLELATGESISIEKAGALREMASRPRDFDMKIEAGEPSALTVHDPRGSTAVRFTFAGKCPASGVIELDHDGHFNAPRTTAGKDGANIMIQAGAWAYRLRCDGDRGPPVAAGRVVVMRDSGTRPLPMVPADIPVDADGRAYSISYQSVIPNLRFRARGDASSFKLHLATAGAEQVFESTTGKITVAADKLKETMYTFWFERDGVRDTKVSTLKIAFDQTTPQVYVQSPAEGKPFGGQVEVVGGALPGWSASINGVAVPIDPASRRFRAKVAPPDGKALVIMFVHPQRGTHVYLRHGD
jgi:hypothetical protein